MTCEEYVVKELQTTKEKLADLQCRRLAETAATTAKKNLQNCHQKCSVPLVHQNS